MKIKNKITSIALASVLGLAGAVHGHNLDINFNFAGEPGDQVSTAGTSSVGAITGAIVDRGPGIGSTAAGNSISSNGWDSLDPTEDFFSFRFDIAAGFSVDIDRLVIGTRSSGAGPGELALRYSGDGFTSDLATFTQSGTAFLNSDIALNLTELTGSVEFRVVATSDVRADGDLGITDTGTFRLVNYFSGGDTGGITFSGTAVPEPGAYAL
ncbi:MAG: hypothetical protein EA353_07615, partial [Puniceicoccaceae bacterium]